MGLTKEKSAFLSVLNLEARSGIYRQTLFTYSVALFGPHLQELLTRKDLAITAYHYMNKICV